MRVRMRLAVATFGALAVAGCSGSSSGGNSAPAGPLQHPTSLKGATGKNDAFVISLTDQDGKPITNLAAGNYKLEVTDFSDIHNFHLTGAGVDDSTPVSGKGTQSFTATFKPGTYTFLCDPHSSQMHGSFTVH